jgi:hypothetical protein
MDYGLVLKEWHWLVIWGSLVALSFTPAFLKAKCPTCKKRKLESISLEQRVREEIQAQEGKPFLSFYECKACGARVLRERSSGYKDASDARWNVAYERAYTTIAS